MAEPKKKGAVARHPILFGLGAGLVFMSLIFCLMKLLGTTSGGSIIATASIHQGYLTVKNEGSETWTNVTLAVNEDYRMRFRNILRGGGTTNPLHEFVRNDGERFDLSRYKPVEIQVLCDQGSWVGNFK
jgi:hypothetical protein